MNNHTIPNNTLSFYQTNIHSLSAHYDTLMEHLRLFNKLPDLITLSDNYLTDDTNQNSFPIPSHIAYHKTDLTIYISTNIHHTIITDITIPDTATCIIEIKNSTTSLATHTIINAYRRPTTNVNVPASEE